MYSDRYLIRIAHALDREGESVRVVRFLNKLDVGELSRLQELHRRLILNKRIGKIAEARKPKKLTKAQQLEKLAWKVRRILKDVGINVTKDDALKLYDGMESVRPKVRTVLPRGTAQALKFVAEIGGKEVVLGEARENVTLTELSKRKGGKREWYTLAKLAGRRGMFSLVAHVKNPSLMRIGYSGGSHNDGHTFSPFDWDMLAKLSKKGSTLQWLPLKRRGAKK